MCEHTCFAFKSEGILKFHIMHLKVFVLQIYKFSHKYLFYTVYALFYVTFSIFMLSINVITLAIKKKNLYFFYFY